MRSLSDLKCNLTIRLILNQLPPMGRKRGMSLANVPIFSGAALATNVQGTLSCC